MSQAPYPIKTSRRTTHGLNTWPREFYALSRMPCSRFVVIRALGGDDLLRPSRAVCEKNTLSCASIVQKCLITADGTALHDEEKTSIGFCFPIPELMASIVFPAKNLHEVSTR